MQTGSVPRLFTDEEYISKLERDNAALRERVEELEAQVSLLTPKYDEYKITGSDSANWNGEGLS
jgi:cell division protein FtsB